MSKEFHQSLVHRTGMALAAVILLAMVNMVASYLTAESSENDAVRINLAGSLRMQSYRIANEYLLASTGSDLGNPAKLEQAVVRFEKQLQTPVLSGHIHSSGNQVLEDAFIGIESEWQQLQPELLRMELTPEDMLQKIDLFVADINELVKKLELQTESKFRVLRFIQGASLLLTIFLASMMFLSVYTYVVGPLNQLVEMAGKLRAGDFSMRLDSANDNELTLLANTFNDMAGSLDGMYRTLEQQVRSKTRHLEEAQKILRFLYDTSRRLSAEGNIISKLERTMDHLRRETDIVASEVHLHHASPDYPFLIISRPESGRLQDSGAASPPATDKQTRTYTLTHDSRDYGCLVVRIADHASFGNEHNLMLTALADTIGASLASETRKEQEHRIALSEERNAMARELHDSIAQSLSFTKIQTSRLQSLLAQNAGKEQIDSVLAEIRAGVQSAYAQLRELLTTFRLQLDSPGLHDSLAATAQEFEDKGGISVTLETTLQNYPLTPNEEIHILQIVREALSNVLRHSGADKATIQLGLERELGRVEVRISDNGSGFSAPTPGPNHYGQTIMRERAQILGGTIEFRNATGGGAEVFLQFTADHAVSGAIEDKRQTGNLAQEQRPL
ncbi:MAG: type IV pili methyl-accepting chemotaxis transducer N-terminal domain-containing protein [Halioglobus sp.]|nr:type IV pili methyl-accepting chemotaxis transducer N-terminal domain-containing protein [Halioglobus sp.]